MIYAYAHAHYIISKTTVTKHDIRTIHSCGNLAKDSRIKKARDSHSAANPPFRRRP